MSAAESEKPVEVPAAEPAAEARAAPAEAAKSGGEAAAATAEEECTATFEPVVQLDEQDVRSGEEEEEILYSKRSKLYVYGESMLDKGTGNYTWLDRGVGQVKILQHRESSMVRLLMRHEKTMKVIMNHITDPRITMSPNNGSDRSWVWSAYDYADGELKETVFALKFGDREIAGEFKTHFEDAQGRMAALLAGADAAPSEEVDAAAEEISKLSTEEKAADTEPKAEGNGSGEKDGKVVNGTPEPAAETAET